MTAQIPESILIDGRPRSMCTEPLEDYFAQTGIRPGFEAICTALWRGYVGHWEIAHEVIRGLPNSHFGQDPNRSASSHFTEPRGKCIRRGTTYLRLSRSCRWTRLLLCPARRARSNAASVAPARSPPCLEGR